MATAPAATRALVMVGPGGSLALRDVRDLSSIGSVSLGRPAIPHALSIKSTKPALNKSTNELPSFTATQLKNETGTVLDRAMSGPVKRTSHARARAYIVPAATFERLMALEEAQLVRRADAAHKRRMIGPEASVALLIGLVNASLEPVARR